MSGTLDARDIDRLSAAVRSGQYDWLFDVNSDVTRDNNDRTEWVQNLRKTWFGDADLDGEFNTQDFVIVFQAGQYEDGIPGNSSWTTGDWNGDGDFDSGDFVVAFQGGGFEQGPRGSAAVPEPAGAALLVVALCGLTFRRRLVAVNSSTCCKPR